MQESWSPRPEAWRRPLWLALLVAASVLSSFGFACAMPFAALCAVAVTTLPRREAYSATGAVWAANQVIGFAFLHYPWTANCLAWGVAIGVSALLCTLAADWVRGRLLRSPSWVGCVVAFAAAFAVLEAALLAFSLPLGGTESFTPSILAGVFALNAVALVGFLVLHRVGVFFGVADSALALHQG